MFYVRKEISIVIGAEKMGYAPRIEPSFEHMSMSCEWPSSENHCIALENLNHPEAAILIGYDSDQLGTGSSQPWRY